MSHFRHEFAIVESETIGDGTKIWAFAHILPGAKIGRDCNICDHTFIENDVTIGDRVTIKCGVQLWDGVTIEDDVFIGPNATFSNDAFPRSKQHQAHVLHTLVKRGASIGANATILPGLTVGEHAMIGAGAVLTHDAPPYAVLVGNPARISDYVGTRPASLLATPLPATAGVHPTAIQGVTVTRLPLVKDARGLLSFGEIERQVPFPVKRYFLVFDVPTKHVRGEHAHRTLHQFLVCVHGQCSVVADDGRNRQEFLLDNPSIGIHIPPRVWTVQYKYSPETVLLALVSDYYDPADYIRDYAEFRALCGEPSCAGLREVPVDSGE